jgi:FKBP-type peptidyl-prolyl cis-trans isomerase FkpA
MKKQFLFGMFVLAMISSTLSCKKTETTCTTVTTAAPDAEKVFLRNYITTNSINATEDSRGFFYSIDSVGGTKPTACSNVTVNYTLRLLNGTLVDNGNNVTFNLMNLIIGWQEGIPLIGKNGKIILYLPPSLAYGSQATSGIPANSYLVFTISLKEVY